ncbi:TrkH family potassium uptake protein [Psychroflexus sediminis]|uniref:Trk-type K+ transport system, membrane component n=1 Tax=Psychroflexus sediminis TaxID=470826 RepID=A0A1G7VPH4_9FLAO|nr:potassium transporter TrkG [Psychroflexus sediminis]SDG61705.1 Trk-type K+ transport system, membrane component [Psychroflexus sediminis]
MNKNTLVHSISFLLSLLGLVILIFDLGFDHPENLTTTYTIFYAVVLVLGVTSTSIRYYQNESLPNKEVVIFDVLSILFSVFVLVRHFMLLEVSFLESFSIDDYWLKFAIIFTFIRESSDIKISVDRTILNPAQLFILSFLTIIFLGSLLLLLPNATHSGISFIDALFTSTSAVCVTGLIVVDTGSYFTGLGQTIILCLIQIGGLGILTFTSFFSYFFKGGSTYENQLTLNSITSSKSLNTVFKTLKYIIVITFGIELVSAILIYTSLDSTDFNGFIDQAFFSVFHAISAFCNAGFSTLSSSFYEEGFRFNYGLQLIIIISFIVGGLGFPIVENIDKYIKYSVKRLIGGGRNFKPWVLNINSRITLITTFTVTAIALVAVYVLEYENTLAEHTGFGKIVTALFTAATPRTAGFNTVDTALLSMPTLLLILLLMWIGASPASTGGGIKTSTLAISVLNILSLAKGKSRIEVFKREISSISVRRSYAIIALSLIVIGFSILILSISDKNLSLFDLVFETISAYSTVGLSLGITGQLSDLGKAVIIFTMFVGRVSMLTVVIAIFKKIKQKNYDYPTEEITIN